jgi:hypothetical protein
MRPILLVDRPYSLSTLKRWCRGFRPQVRDAGCAGVADPEAEDHMMLTQSVKDLKYSFAGAGNERCIEGVGNEAPAANARGGRQRPAYPPSVSLGDRGPVRSVPAVGASHGCGAIPIG